MDNVLISSSSVLYCDMDGVLCDFFSSACAISGKPPGELSVKELWRHVRKVDDFWESLQWMPGGRALWEHIERHQPHILSSIAASDPNCAPGKLKWLRQNLNFTDSERIHLPRRKDKCLFAVAGETANVLVDDYIRNISEWEAKGGIAIHHQDADETIERLKGLGFG